METNVSDARATGGTAAGRRPTVEGWQAVAGGNCTAVGSQSSDGERLGQERRSRRPARLAAAQGARRRVQAQPGTAEEAETFAESGRLELRIRHGALDAQARGRADRTGVWSPLSSELPQSPAEGAGIQSTKTIAASRRTRARARAGLARARFAKDKKSRSGCGPKSASGMNLAAPFKKPWLRLGLGEADDRSCVKSPRIAGRCPRRWPSPSPARSTNGISKEASKASKSLKRLSICNNMFPAPSS